MRRMWRSALVAGLLVAIVPVASSAQVLGKSGYHFDQPAPVPRLAGNAVTDILLAGGKIWAGTGGGLSVSEDGGRSWRSYSRAHGLGKGGVSALAIRGDTIWTATAFDTLITNIGYLPAGGGLSYSIDGGATWQWIPQPGPTPVQNVTYDIALTGEAVWITSWGGGLRRSLDMGQTWEVVTPDTFLFDPYGNLNHRAFAVIAVEDTLWVGTAKGINKSIDGGRTWLNMNHQNQPQPISGNFVVALAHQRYEGKSLLWAATIEAEDPDEFRAVSVSDDGGKSWRTVLRGEFVHNFGFDPVAGTVYAVSDNGLWKSVAPDSFLVFPPIVDANTGERVYTTQFYCAALGQDGYLWVGTADGLARTNNNGFTWQVFRAYVPTGTAGAPRTYAYPNPFSPMRHNQLGADGYVRFQYNTTKPTRVTIRIYDFAMDLVATVVEGKARPVGDFSEAWNGRNDGGDLVANGVYFYRLDIEGEGTFWGKVMILN
ncbi:MAG: hypothetical protein H5U38_07365 [Calditrichaeota bacterium]|nr:hypothetical protein [Calditrichota bacterium]